MDEVEVRCDDDEERAGLDAVDLGTAAAAYREALTTDTQLAAPSDFEALSLSSDRSRGLAAIMAAHEGEGIHTGGFGIHSDINNAGDGGRGDDSEEPGSPTRHQQHRSFGHHRRNASIGGSGGAVLHQGYLLKRSSNLRADWKRRFFVLDALGHLTYYRDKDVSSAGAAKETVRLLTATIKPDLEDSPNMRFCFRVVSPHKVYCLQA